MVNYRALNIFLTGLCFFYFTIWVPPAASAQEQVSQYEIPDGVHIELTKDFYEALKNSSSSGKRVYTNDKSIEYLKEIAISSKCMVETNLQILKQLEMILQKLNDPREDKKK